MPADRNTATQNIGEPRELTAPPSGSSLIEVMYLPYSPCGGSVKAGGLHRAREVNGAFEGPVVGQNSIRQLVKHEYPIGTADDGPLLDLAPCCDRSCASSHGN